MTMRSVKALLDFLKIKSQKGEALCLQKNGIGYQHEDQLGGAWYSGVHIVVIEK
jgi:hypothetical protein